MRWDEMKWNEIKCDEMKWDKIKLNKTRCKEMRWDGMRWDEMKWNDMKWNKIKKERKKEIITIPGKIGASHICLPSYVSLKPSINLSGVLISSLTPSNSFTLCGYAVMLFPVKRIL